MADIPRSHPRYESLNIREKLVKGVEEGITSKAGLIAHGRGEAFDYIIGETTVRWAERAERAAVSVLKEAEDPVISVNGNVAALVPGEVVEFAERIRAKIEINLFHRTEKRVSKIHDRLKETGAKGVLGTEPDAELPGLDHDRSLCSKRGIYSADVVLVPLEDGDRAKALKDMGKTVITVDLNPLSRTAQTADITIVDNVVRALPNMIELEPLEYRFDNNSNLSSMLEYMSSRLKEMAEEQR